MNEGQSKRMESPPKIRPKISRVPSPGVSAAQTTAANRRWWDDAADAYQDEHGAFLGGSSGGAAFIWGPEGLDEADARLLGDIRGRHLLEIGAGAAQCSRWLLRQGAFPVALDLSFRQLRHSRTLDSQRDGQRDSQRDSQRDRPVPVLKADAAHLPLADECVDDAFSAYGAVPFVADAAAVHREVARVLRPGGRWVFSVTHPVRWAFPDDPGPAGLVARESYFDRTPYAERDDAGQLTYVEHHRTLGDHVRAITASGLCLVDLVEPEWPPGHHRTWGGWSALRGRLIPGTAIFSCVKPGWPQCHELTAVRVARHG